MFGEKGSMVVTEILAVAFAAIRANAMRSILTTLGIIIGVASVIVLTALGEGHHRGDVMQPVGRLQHCDHVVAEDRHAGAGGAEVDAYDGDRLDPGGGVAAAAAHRRAGRRHLHRVPGVDRAARPS